MNQLSIAPPPSAPWLALGIGGLALALLAVWGALVWIGGRSRPERRAASATFLLGAGLWAMMTLGLATSGMLARLDLRPPPFAVIPLGLVVGTILVMRSRAGAILVEETPLWMLVLLQSFRLPLELLMHAAAQAGIMPPHMSFGVTHGVVGLNYDIVTGASALLLGLALRTRPVPRAVVLAWNLGGLALLLIIVGVGVSSTPLFARFGSAPSQLNTWMLFAPYVWLPAILVASALLGHLVIFAKLRRTVSSRS